MKNSTLALFVFLFSILSNITIMAQPSPDSIKFVRQGAKRLLFNDEQSIPLASLNPQSIVGFPSMHPTKHYGTTPAQIQLQNGKLMIASNQNSETAIWFGGFNPFATYTIHSESTTGEGEFGYQFASEDQSERFIVSIKFKDNMLTDSHLRVIRQGKTIINKSIAVNLDSPIKLEGRIILQMLGSGFTLYLQNQNVPVVIGQSNFNKYIDLRKIEYLHAMQSHLYARTKKAKIVLNKVKMQLSAGVGLADIRAITYENGEPLLEDQRLWYTMSIRGRALPHHIQGVFSMNPSAFDIKLEGIIVFDRGDGLLRNEIASHIFYDRKHKVWRGLTTGFSAYANPEKEKKQLLAIETKKDPRFGFSIMKADTFGMIGDIEDPHILFDSSAKKWRMLTCENNDGYKAIVLESDYWDKGYTKIAGPVAHNSTGTSIQKIGKDYFCFSGSSEREIFIYSYPDLKEMGTLQMDLPPWDPSSGTRVWPNVVELPEGYPFRYVALMMDRYNFPGLNGPNWTYGALYLYHGY